MWISIEGLPLKVWTQNIFNKIASKWGERFKVIVQGILYWIRVKELEAWVLDFYDKKYASSSSDGESFGEDDEQVSGTKKQDKLMKCIRKTLLKFDILEKKKENIGHSSEEEPKFPPRFTPIDKDGEEEVAHQIDHPKILENNMEPGISNDTSQRCKNLFSKVQNRGSFLDVVDELVKVGQTMRYNMEGCMNNIESIIGSQGDGGYTYTWAHKSASKINKHLSNHRPILMRELNVDYGATSFRVFHSWFNMEGFDKFVKNSWKNSNLVETNGMVLLKKKLQMLKEDIKLWSKEVRKRSSNAKLSIQKKISDVDKVLDQGGFSEDNVKYRLSLLKDLQDIISTETSDIAQKAKVRWSIEGDENSKYFHGSHFSKPEDIYINLDAHFPNRLSGDQVEDLERPISFDEIKRVVWNYGTNKSLRLDGFTFEFFRRYWSLIAQDLVAAISYFIHQILDGPFILNELMSWCKHKKLKSMIFKIDFEKAFDCVWWEKLLVLVVFGVDGLVVVSIMLRAQFLLMVARRRLRINIHKSKLMGIGVHSDEVYNTTRIVECSTFSTPFNYLGVKVDVTVSKISSWDEVNSKVKSRLSKWKLSSLSIGGRLTLLKSVISSIPLYHISIFKVPLGVINNLKSIRRNFFNGVDGSNKKLVWISWEKVLMSKKKGGLGLASLFSLNRGLMFKWIWRFKTQIQSLCARVIKSIYGANGALDKPNHNYRRSPLLDILHEASALKLKGIDLYDYIHKEVGNGEDTVFWEDHWGGAEDTQFGLFNSCLANLLFPQMRGRWYWLLEGSGDFSVKSIRILINDTLSFIGDVPTRWVRSKVLRWWEIDDHDLHSYNEWLSWINSICMSSMLKRVSEGICYVMW
nr:hypothetical protein [Tanacetum cinerariifolium]